MKRVYFILLLFVLACYGFLIIHFIGMGPAMPVEDDETQHYNNAKAFALYNSLKASDVVNEDVAKFTGADWYGPVYPVFFGSFMKLMQGSDKSYIYTNFLLFIAIAFLLLKFKWASLEARLFALLGFLLIPAFLSYLFYYMPSVLDVFLATLLLLLIWRISIADNNSRTSRIILFCVSTVIIAFIKENFIFFMIAIVPFLTGKKQYAIAGIGFLLGLVLVMSYASFFLAQSYLKSVVALSQLLTFKFSGFIEMKHLLGKVGAVVITNIKDIVYHSDVPHLYLISYLMVFILPFINLYFGYKLKNQFLLSVSLVSSFMVIVYVLLYTTYWHYMIRISIPIILFDIVGFILWAKERTIIQYAVLGVLIIMFPWNISSVIEQQGFKSKKYVKVEVLKKEYGNSLANFIGCSEYGITTVLYDEKFWDKYGQTFILALPLVDNCNNRIRYTSNLDKKDRYKLWGKLHIDYLLSTQPLQLANYKLVTSNQDYFLYKL